MILLLKNLINFPEYLINHPEFWYIYRKLDNIHFINQPRILSTYFKRIINSNSSFLSKLTPFTYPVFQGLMINKTQIIENISLTNKAVEFCLSLNNWKTFST